MLPTGVLKEYSTAVSPAYCPGARSPVLRDAEAQPELLAYHYTEAGLKEQAVPYWYHAGQRANERSAMWKRSPTFGNGLEVLQTLPHT